MNIGFLGTGHIAAPMARSAARQGHAVTVSRRSEAVSHALATSGLGICVADNQAVLDASDLVVLSLRPAAWREAVAGLTWRSQHRILSVMAGVPLAEIAAACAPVRDLSVTIPFTFLEQGGCPLPVYRQTRDAAAACAVQAIWGAENPVIDLPSEADLLSHFSATPIVPGVLLLLEAAIDDLAAATGQPDASELYVSQLVAGYLGALETDRHGRAAEARAGLATPNTLSLRMVDALRGIGAPAQVSKIMQTLRGEMGAGAR